MLIAYDTRTENVKRFVEKCEMSSVRITENLIVREPFILVTYTTGFGQIPPSTSAFLANNFRHMKGVAVSGNRNWGKNFGACGDKISNMYKVPLLVKFEICGTYKDIELFKKGVQEICGTLN